jgi:MFS family permease
MQHEAVKPATGLPKIVIAACAGTVIEWYDFFIFGSLSTILASHFFPDTGSAGLLKTLGVFATGFFMRPFGAVVFGRMGDMLGRKHTFLLTLLMMGFSTAAIGLIPDYHVIGFGAPALLILLRLIQGLALGGQYGGAAIYIAEHAPEGRRGFFTSFLQTTATIGLLISLMIILGLKAKLGLPQFEEWGWRIPFLLSSLLVIFSYLVRKSMAESPAFSALQAEGGVSKNPLVESFANPVNREKVLIALFGLVAGQGVIWYTAQFYVNLFLTQTMHVAASSADQIVAWGLVFGTPFFILFGALSDRIGRKKIIMLGLALSVFAYFPIYQKIQSLTTISMIDDSISQKISFVKNPKTGVLERFHSVSVKSPTGDVEQTTYREDANKSYFSRANGPPKDRIPPVVSVIPSDSTFWTLVGLVFLQVLFVTMAYGPIAAFLVEMFPVQIRYTSMSVPYHIGNGVFGGLVPVVGVALVASMHNALAGLIYPVGVALLTIVVGMIFIHEKWSDDGGFAEET